MKFHKKHITAVALLAFVGAGCVKTSLEAPNGWKASRTAVGLNATVGEFSVKNGDFNAHLTGYQTRDSMMIESVARGVVSGLNPASAGTSLIQSTNSTLR